MAFAAISPKTPFSRMWKMSNLKKSGFRDGLHGIKEIRLGSWVQGSGASRLILVTASKFVS